MPAPAPGHLPPREAREVLLVRAHETGAPNPLWSEDDARWATRLARETHGRGDPAPFIAARAHHALQRLGPREPRVAALQRQPTSVALGPAAGLAAALGTGLGLAIDHIGSSQQINLLAPPIWLLVGWNLGLALLFTLSLLRRPRLPQVLRSSALTGWLVRHGPGSMGGGGGGDAGAPPGSPWQRFAAAWQQARLPAFTARAAMALHLAAAALALGLVGGLYLRGLVLDYRAGWQSTFLAAPTVQRTLAVALAPASALTGVAVPDAAPLRQGPGVAATGPAAPWIHLYAATLLLFVIAPRGLLAWRAARRALGHQQRLALPLHEPYFQRLLLARSGDTACVRVLHSPDHTPPPADHARMARALTPRLGGEPRLQFEPWPAEPSDGTAGATVVWLDLASTPEAEVHGRLLAALARQAEPAAPLLLVVDTQAFRQRFASLPGRVAEREALWRRFAAEQGVECLLVGGPEGAMGATPTPAPGAPPGHAR